MSAVVGIQCDGCGITRARTTVLQPAAGPERARAKADGWHTKRGTFESTRVVGVKADGTVVRATYGYTRDLCPTCWKAGKR